MRLAAQHHAFFGEHQGPAGPVKKFNAKLTLKFSDLLGHCGLRETEPYSRRGKRALVGSSKKRFKQTGINGKSGFISGLRTTLPLLYSLREYFAQLPSILLRNTAVRLKIKISAAFFTETDSCPFL